MMLGVMLIIFSLGLVYSADVFSKHFPDIYGFSCDDALVFCSAVNTRATVSRALAVTGNNKGFIRLSDHIGLLVSGSPADTQYFIKKAAKLAATHTRMFGEPISALKLATQLSRFLRFHAINRTLRPLMIQAIIGSVCTDTCPGQNFLKLHFSGTMTTSSDCECNWNENHDSDTESEEKMADMNGVQDYSLPKKRPLLFHRIFSQTRAKTAVEAIGAIENILKDLDSIPMFHVMYKLRS
jgi:hypothetical protein